MIRQRTLTVCFVLGFLAMAIDSEARCRFRRARCCSPSPCITLPALPESVRVGPAIGYSTKEGQPSISHPEDPRTSATYEFNCPGDPGSPYSTTSSTCALAKRKAEQNFCEDHEPVTPPPYECKYNIRDDKDPPIEFAPEFSPGQERCIARVRVRYCDGKCFTSCGVGPTRQIAEADAIINMHAMTKHHGCATWYCWLPTVCNTGTQAAHHSTK